MPYFFARKTLDVPTNVEPGYLFSFNFFTASSCAPAESLGIDPKTKTLLFSDSLDFERADKIASYFAGKVKIAFGIGTYISNDTDVPALNIVMKTTKCNGMDVAKISDTPGKGMCKNPEYVEYLQRCISWRMENDR